MKLLITLPTPGKVHTGFMESMIGLTQELQSKKIPFAVKTYQFSDIVQSRNFLMSYFISSSFTHCLLLDCDLMFLPGEFMVHYELNEDFSASIYPRRRIRSSRLAKAIQEECKTTDLADIDAKEILTKSYDYTITNQLNNREVWKPKHKGDFVTVPTIGAGFILINRNVPEKMIENNQVRRFKRNDQQVGSNTIQFHDFFSHLADQENTFLYGEDQSFCRRWIEGCGGDIWCHKKSKLTHTGDFDFVGNFEFADIPWLKE